MSWTDKNSVETICKLRDEFNIKYFLETGTYKGTNALLQSKNFDYVFTCEINEEYINIANSKLGKIPTVYVYRGSSPAFLEDFKLRKERKSSSEVVFIYLDAHFYDANLPAEKRFVVLDELRALKEFKNCIICIHDFDNGEFGHITYDGVSLDLNLLKEDLLKVNPDFKFYTNTKCDIIKTGAEVGLEDDEEMKSTLEFVWSKPEKTYRGLLYCVPKELDLTKYDLRQI